MQSAVAIGVDHHPSSGTAFFLMYKNLRKSFRLWLLRQSSIEMQMTPSIDFQEKHAFATFLHVIAYGGYGK
jgi:hypothetical protein